MARPLLCNILLQKLQKNKCMGARSRAGASHAYFQVVFCLRMLANAQYLDIMLCFGASMPAVYMCTHAVCTALLSTITLPGLPRTDSERRITALEFTRSRFPPSPIEYCVGAVDGIAIEI